MQESRVNFIPLYIIAAWKHLLSIIKKSLNIFCSFLTVTEFNHNPNLTYCTINWLKLISCLFFSLIHHPILYLTHICSLNQSYIQYTTLTQITACEPCSCPSHFWILIDLMTAYIFKGAILICGRLCPYLQLIYSKGWLSLRWIFN